MSFSDVFARTVALIGGTALLLRRVAYGSPEPAWGSTPAIPAAKPQGRIPTLKMPTAQGWAHGQTPVAAPGLKVNAFATGLKHPRWIDVLPNGDVLVAESTTVPRDGMRNIFDYAMVATMQRAAAVGVSANRITLLRDADGDGVAEIQEVFLEGLNQPFGMALLGETFYVGNTDGVVAFPYTPGANRITAPGRTLATFKPGGHWTRSLLPSPDGRKLYVGVGSSSNIAENGMASRGRPSRSSTNSISRAARAAPSPPDCAMPWAWRGSHRPARSGRWSTSATAWATKRRPDYLTSVRDGGFYGWPYCYWGQTVDDRVPQDPAAVAKAITPDYALGGHTASLGLCWLPAGTLPGFPEGMAIGQHGSWNRSKLSGYKLVFVPFANGRPAGPPRDILSGFLAPDERVSYGRPVGRGDRSRRFGADGGRCGRRDLARDGRAAGLSGLRSRG